MSPAFHIGIPYAFNGRRGNHDQPVPAQVRVDFIEQLGARFGGSGTTGSSYLEVK